MDPTVRGRSPSASQASNLGRSPSPAHPATDFNSDQSASVGHEQQSAAFANTGAYNSQHANPAQTSFDDALDFGASSHLFGQQSQFAQDSLFQDQGLTQANSAAQFSNQDSSLFDFSGLENGPGMNEGFDGPLFPSTEIDPHFLTNNALDPRLLEAQQHQAQADQDSAIAQMNANMQSPTPPHLLSPALHRHSSNSPHNSPSLHQGGFPAHSPAHSRNASLDPSSAAYPQMQAWNGGDAFRGHRRAPSEAHSDVSSSAHPSPFLHHEESFEHVLNNHSPMLGAQQDQTVFQEVVAPMDQFSISQAPNAYISPAHSPNPSPRLIPQQQPLPVFTSSDEFGLQSGLVAPMPTHFNGIQGFGILPSQRHDQFPEFGQNNIDMSGQADTMTPPEINIQLVPPSRQTSFEPPKPDGSDNGLSPPQRTRSRNSRERAKSDSFVGGSSRPTTPNREHRDMLSPAAAGVGSRSPSPSGKGRRSSTSNVPNRDYILDLADPGRPSSNSVEGGSASKRTQKHPATFQCSLCPKRFTRAYNLRSHLRTHTDERPFVCSVCGKAFARQHDRKRHEGLHSGEKKFVCRGSLKDGNPWGCGRRFARADALGRHFRSEAGRVCIKPLLEEEALERMQQGQDQNAAAVQSMGQMGPGMVGQSMMQPPQTGFDSYGSQGGYDASMMGQMPYRLPAALLQQYPTLGGIWDTLPSNVPDDVEGNISGRSSFDASSAGEYDDAEESYGPGAYGWASDVGP